MADLCYGMGGGYPRLHVPAILQWTGEGSGGHTLYPASAPDQSTLNILRTGIVPFAAPYHQRTSLRYGNNITDEMPLWMFYKPKPGTTYAHPRLIQPPATPQTGQLQGVDFGGYGVPTANPDVFTPPIYDVYQGVGAYEGFL